MNELSCDEHTLVGDARIQKNSAKAKWVLIITVVMMFIEIYFGWLTGSMALLADGWHMATHAAALGITFAAYKIATTPRIVRNFNFGGGKIIALGGFASSVFLLLVVFAVFFESIARIIEPKPIRFSEALIVAVVGLAVNIVSAFILHDNHSHSHNHDHDNDGSHDHDHGDNDHPPHAAPHQHDHNLRGAFMHVIADAITSVGAIAGLLVARNTGWLFLDPVIAIASSFFILRWAYGLIKETGWELLDGHAKTVNFDALHSRIVDEGAEILDLHVWRISPKALACELIVRSQQRKGIAYWKSILEKEFCIQHTVVEEH